MWWHMPLIPVPRKLKQEDCEFEASSGYTMRSWSPKNKKKNGSNGKSTVEALSSNTSSTKTNE
jgi:hypothetical protein